MTGLADAKRCRSQIQSAQTRTLGTGVSLNCHDFDGQDGLTITTAGLALDMWGRWKLLSTLLSHLGILGPKIWAKRFHGRSNRMNPLPGCIWCYLPKLRHQLPETPATSISVFARSWSPFQKKTPQVFLTLIHTLYFCNQPSGEANPPRAALATRDNKSTAPCFRPNWNPHIESPTITPFRAIRKSRHRPQLAA